VRRYVIEITGSFWCIRHGRPVNWPIGASEPGATPLPMARILTILVVQLGLRARLKRTHFTSFFGRDFLLFAIY
jgi:hypothetical protein